MALLLVVQAIAQIQQLGIQRLDGRAAGVVAFSQLLKLFRKIGTGAVRLAGFDHSFVC